MRRRSLDQTKRYLRSLKEPGRLALRGWARTVDAEYRHHVELATASLNARLEQLDRAGDDDKAIDATKATIRAMLAAIEANERADIDALAEALVRHPVTLPRHRLSLLKSTVPIVLGHVTPPKKNSGGQRKYELAEIERLITVHQAENGFRHRSEALRALLFKACSESESADLQEKARRIAQQRDWFEQHELLTPRRALMRAVDKIEGPHLHSLDNLLTENRRKQRGNAR